MKLRTEREEDACAIRGLHMAAFPTPQEAALVDALRAARAATVSEVAVDEEVIVGHVLLSPVALEGVTALALAPLAVHPKRQREGIGAALVRRALERAKEKGAGVVVLVGEPHYYERFGFLPARKFGLHCKWPDTEEAFMALELRPGALNGARGLVSYHPAFDGL
jgi:putative acetyltransferase